jgi:hypothetical protein
MKKPRRSGQDAARARNLTHTPISAPPSAGQPIHTRPAARARAPLAFGPWSPGVDPVERVAQLRCLAGLAAVFLISRHPLVAALIAAEADNEAAGHRARNARPAAVPDAAPALGDL